VNKIKSLLTWSPFGPHANTARPVIARLLVMTVLGALFTAKLWQMTDDHVGRVRGLKVKIEELQAEASVLDTELVSWIGELIDVEDQLALEKVKTAELQAGLRQASRPIAIKCTLCDGVAHISRDEKNFSCGGYKSHFELHEPAATKVTLTPTRYTGNFVDSLSLD